MRLPFRNYHPTPLTIFIEPECDQYEVPAGGMAIVTLEDGLPHSIDVHPEQWISIWSEGGKGKVEISDTHGFRDCNRDSR
jgi:hypothetical protein